MEASKLAAAAASRRVSLSSGGHESSCHAPSLLFSRGYPMVIEPEPDLYMPYLANPKCKGAAGHQTTEENDSSSSSWIHSLPGHSRYQGSWYTDKFASDLTF